MNESKLQANINSLREFVQSKGWTIVGEKEIQSGYQLVVADGINKVPVAFFTSGKALFQGKPGALQTELKSWWYARQTSSTQPTIPTTTQSSFIKAPSTDLTKSFTGRPRIGLDE